MAKTDHLQNGDQAEPDEEASVASNGRHEVEPGLAAFGRILQSRRTVEENVQHRNVVLESVVRSADVCKDVIV